MHKDVKIITIRDFISLICAHKKNLLLGTLVGMIFGVIIAYSIPEEYETTAKIVPIIEGSYLKNDRLVNLLRRVDISEKRQGNDGIDAYLYPEIVSSYPFLLDVLNTVVCQSDSQDSLPLSLYLQKHTASPWWKKIPGFPKRIIGLLKKNNEKKSVNEHPINPYKPTEKDDGLFNALGSRIKIKIDDESNVISISSIMQDPLVAALVNDSVISYLDSFIINYKNNKINDKLVANIHIRDSIRNEYFLKQEELAKFIDNNNSLSFETAKSKRYNLENETYRLLNTYKYYYFKCNDLESNKLQKGSAFVILSPGTVSLKPVNPNKIKIITICSLFGFSICLIWYLSLSKTYTQWINNLNQINNLNTESRKRDIN